MSFHKAYVDLEREKGIQVALDYQLKATRFLSNKKKTRKEEI